VAEEEAATADRGRQTDGDARPAPSRRRLLRTGINLGVSGALVWGYGADYVSSSDLDTITYAMARPEPDAETLEPRTKDVPVGWHESMRLAFGIQEKIREAGLSPLLGSFIVPGSYSDPEASISVDATDESLSETIGNLTDGVNVEVNVIDEIPPKAGEDLELADAYQISDLNADGVPGGVICEGGEKYGTLTPALFDAETGERYFATSNHVFGASGTKETEHRGDPLRVLHDDEPYHVGDVQRGFPESDVVRVSPVSEYEPASVVERATPRRVIGQYTKMGLADLMARNESLTKLGAMTDETTGSIKGVDGLTCYAGEACKSGQLKWGDEGTLRDGDSGSVNFHADPENPDDYVLVGGINNARTWWPGANFAWGTAGYHLLDAYGLHF
jgi:hypothetical protein